MCQSIFEKDKLLFTFLLAFRILEGEKCLDDKLFEFFLHGQLAIKSDENNQDDQDKRKGAGNGDDEDDEETKAKLKRDQLMEKLATLNEADYESKKAKDEALMR